MKTTRPNPRLSLLAFLCLLSATWQVLAQSSANSISFQGALTGANGQALPNDNYGLTFKFYDVPTGGTALATSNVPNVPVTGGIASTPIPVDAGWFNGQTRYLGIAIAGINNGQELSPRVLITAVPYAITSQTLGYGTVNIGTNGNVGIGTTNPSERLEILGGNLKLNRTEDEPTGPRSISFSTKNNAGGSVQTWSINADPVGRFDFDQHICDFWIGNRVDNGRWDKHFYIERFGNIGLWNMNENPNSKTLYFRNRNNTAGSVQDWAITAQAVPGRYNVDNHICDFWIGNRVIYADGSGGTWDKHLYITKIGNVCLGADNPQAKLDVRGTTRTQVLQITGGADLAEHLSVTDALPDDEFQVEPGMVVSIDPSGNRKFKLSDEAYDRKRVGIISGGNGVKPGLILAAC